jgi:chromosomal replication initiation ATPase DnaA
VTEPPRQLVLDLPTRPALGRADFFVAEPNRLALAQIERWPAWPEGKLALVGPPGAGKTHLVHVWATRAGAVIVPAAALADSAAPARAARAVAVEDVSALWALGADAAARAEEALFHLHNRVLGGGGALLVTGVGRPTAWRIGLPDLASRLAAAVVAELAPPDDALLAAVLVKLFEDRQLEAGPDLVRYLLPRIERTFAGAQAVVRRLDALALARRRPVTARLAAEALEAPEAE